jgi:type I restriction enzyme S subunit
VRRGDSAARLDPQYLEVNRRKRAYYASPRYPMVPLGKLATFIQYGISERANTAGLGVPMIRMNNLQANGWDLSDLKHIELEDADLDRYRLLKGDLLFNRTNSKELVGKCEAFAEDGDWVFASYLIRVRLDAQRAVPGFVSAFLNSPAGRIQIDQVSRQVAGMSNVNAEELRDLLIPLPGIAEQQRLLVELEAARLERDAALAGADQLLYAVDELITSALGLPKVGPPTQGGYAIRLGLTKTVSTISADYFHPERMGALKAIKALPNAPLGSLVSFQRQIVSSPGESRYIGLASVASQSGQLTDTVETATGQCFEFGTDDVLYGRLRPYLNKVWLAEFAGVCSTEFHVMRVRDRSTLLPAYLAVVMRTRLIVAQTKHMMTGNTHPRLANEDVVNLLIPLAEIAAQRRIVDETLVRQTEATRLRDHADSLWQKARARFAQQLLKADIS